VFERTNTARAEHDLPPVVVDERLAAVARAHSLDMARRGFFSHDNLEGLSPSQRLALGFAEHVGSSGENIYSIDTDHTLLDDEPAARAVARRLLEGWMDSPGHRANILRPDFTRLGVGVYATEDDVWATQVFSRPLAILSAPLLANLRCGDRLGVRFEPGPDLARTPDLRALLRWPDPNRRFVLPGGRSYMQGTQPLVVRRHGRLVEVEVVVGDLPGRYVLLAGAGSTFWELGSWHARR